MRSECEPDVTPSTGAVIQSLLDKRGITAEELSQRTMLLPEVISRILDGGMALTPTLVHDIAEALDIEPTFLAMVEANYRDHLFPIDVTYIAVFPKRIRYPQVLRLLTDSREFARAVWPYGHYIKPDWVPSTNDNPLACVSADDLLLHRRDGLEYQWVPSVEDILATDWKITRY